VDANDDLVALGAAIRRRRKLLKLSQEGLAEGAGLHRNYIGQVERGERNASATTLFGIARAMGLKLEELVKGL
jgi:transcriptional regulator with XRE-family HTH domain